MGEGPQKHLQVFVIIQFFYVPTPWKVTYEWANRMAQADQVEKN